MRVQIQSRARILPFFEIGWIDLHCPLHNDRQRGFKISCLLFDRLRLIDQIVDSVSRPVELEE